MAAADLGAGSGAGDSAAAASASTRSRLYESISRFRKKK